MNFVDSVSTFVGRSTEYEPVVHRICSSELDCDMGSLGLRASTRPTHVILFDDSHLSQVATQLRELRKETEAATIILVSPLFDQLGMGEPLPKGDGFRKFEFTLGPSGGGFSSRVIRVIDILCALILLVIWLPFHILFSLLILVTSGRPVIFRQDRVGIGETPFTMFKYRSMRAKNDDSNHQQFVKALYQKHEQSEYKLSCDNRITRLGAFLRKLSIDEIPQLVNVLRGSMSLIGPRPCLDYELEEMEEWHKTRFNMRPGISGLWQVYGRSRCTIEQSQFLDSLLFHSHSITQHVILILKTPLAVFAARGAR